MVLSNLFGKLIMKHINSYLYVLLLAVLHLSAITFKEDFFLFIRVNIFCTVFECPEVAPSALFVL